MNYTQPTRELPLAHEVLYNDRVGNHINRSWPCVTDGASIAEVSQMLAVSPFSGYTVINDEGRVVGFITEKDCLKYTLSEKYYHEPTTLVSHYMSRNIITFGPDENLLKALESFVEHPCHVYPVVDGDGRYLGCASRKELLRVALNLKESVWDDQLVN